jgi:predicted glycoside hydrolase/deacetylase ChbG (UPF0249 family)
MLKKMGFKETDKLLIINADDYGLDQGTNRAIEELFKYKAITSSTVMMPCKCSKEVRDLHEKIKCTSIGIHLTLTGRFKPVSNAKEVSTLITTEGFFYDSSEYMELHGDNNHVKQELINQIEAAISLGIDPTHLDSHQGSVFGLFTGRDFMEEVFDLCLEYKLPFLLPKQVVKEGSLDERLRGSFKKYIKKAEELGLMLIDDIISLPYYLQEGEDYKILKCTIMDKLSNVGAGITQVTIHPSFATEELKTINEHWRKREMEFNLFLDEEIKKLLLKEDIKLISWKEIRDFQRSITGCLG